MTHRSQGGKDLLGHFFHLPAIAGLLSAKVGLYSNIWSSLVWTDSSNRAPTTPHGILIPQDHWSQSSENVLRFALNFFPLLNFIPLILLITPQATLNNIPSSFMLTFPPILVGREIGEYKNVFLAWLTVPSIKWRIEMFWIIAKMLGRQCVADEKGFPLPKNSSDNQWQAFWV